MVLWPVVWVLRAHLRFGKVCTVSTGFRTCYPQPPVAYVLGLVVYIRSLGFWRGYSGFIMFIEGLQMVHRKLQEGLLRVLGSIEGLYLTRATPIPVTAFTFEARQNLQGPK